MKKMTLDEYRGQCMMVEQEMDYVDNALQVDPTESADALRLVAAAGAYATARAQLFDLLNELKVY